MTSPSDIVLRSLLVFEEQLSQLRGYALHLEAANGTGDTPRAFAAASGVRRVFDDLAIVYTRLRTHVVALDSAEMGDTVGSFGELAIRAEMIVVETQLRALRGAIEAEPRQGTISSNSLAVFGEWLQSINEVGLFIRNEFERINAIWLPHRKSGDPSPAREERAERYRGAIRDAQQALIALGNDPDVSRILRAGTACMSWPAVRGACVRITLTFQISLDVEPYLALLHRPFIEAPLDACADVGLRKQ